MEQPAGTQTVATEMVTFYLGKSIYGIDILKVQEINKLTNWTPVPGSENYVLGILSLRGSIVTVLDLGKKLETNCAQLTNTSRNIIAKSDNHRRGFLVDKVGDVVSVDVDQICPAPTNVNGIQGKFFDGVLKTNDGLVAILDVEELFKDNESVTQN